MNAGIRRCSLRLRRRIPARNVHTYARNFASDVHRAGTYVGWRAAVRITRSHGVHRIANDAYVRTRPLRTHCHLVARGKPENPRQTWQALWQAISRILCSDSLQNREKRPDGNRDRWHRNPRPLFAQLDKSRSPRLNFIIFHWSRLRAAKIFLLSFSVSNDANWYFYIAYMLT